MNGIRIGESNATDVLAQLLREFKKENDNLKDEVKLQESRIDGYKYDLDYVKNELVKMKVDSKLLVTLRLSKDWYDYQENRELVEEDKMFTFLAKCDREDVEKLLLEFNFEDILVAISEIYLSIKLKEKREKIVSTTTDNKNEKDCVSSKDK